MLSKLGTPFRMKGRNGKVRENDNYYSSNFKAVGLGILVHRSPEPNLVVKQSRKLAPSLGSSTRTNSNNPCFLKTCFLCNKNLDPQEDIYMYRGDQGYCSIKCRNQQIDIDEKRELEASTRKILASFRQCHKNEPTETRFLLEDLRRQHNRLPHPRIRPVVS